jgi:hypothetical protein
MAHRDIASVELDPLTLKADSRSEMWLTIPEIQTETLPDPQDS